MMTNFDWSILLQIPLVGAFIWYSIKMQEAYSKSMANRDREYLATLRDIANDVKANTQVISQMLSKVDRACNKQD